MQVGRTAVGGLHDDAAPTQGDGEIAGGLRAGESGAFAEFDHAAIFQEQHGVGVFSGADLDTVGEVLAGGHELDSGGQDLIKRAVDGVDDGAACVVAVLIYGEPDGESGGGDYGSGDGPAGGIVDAARGGRAGHGNHAAFVNAAACDAFMQMVFGQEGAGLGKVAGLEFRDRVT